MADTADLYTLIQEAVSRIINASKLTEPTVGTVVSTSPLNVKITDKITLPKGNLILVKGLNLEVGDSVLIIRAAGGQKYYVIGEVGHDTA